MGGWRDEGEGLVPDPNAWREWEQDSTAAAKSGQSVAEGQLLMTLMVDLDGKGQYRPLLVLKGRSPLSDTEHKIYIHTRSGINPLDQSNHSQDRR